MAISTVQHAKHTVQHGFSTQTTPPRSFKVAFFAVCLLATGLCGCGKPQPTEQLVRKARLKVASGRADEALNLISKVTKDDPLWESAQLIAGDVHMQSGRFAEAASVWQSLLDSSPSDPGRTHLFAGQCHRELGALEKAEQHFLLTLKYGYDTTASQNMAFLYCVSGRQWRALPHFRALLIAEDFTLDGLALMADLGRPIEQKAFLVACAEKRPTDRLVRLGLAAHEFWEGHATNARKQLGESLRVWPDCPSARAMLGELLLDQDPTEFQRWYATLTQADLKHPDIWYVTGMFARKHDRLNIAAECFRMALHIVPSHRRAAYQLSQILNVNGDGAAVRLTAYAADLMKLSEAIDNVLRSGGQAAERIELVVSLLEQTGRLQEAVAWSRLAASAFPHERWPIRVLAKHRSTTDEDTPLVILEKTPIPSLQDPNPKVDLTTLFDSLGTEIGSHKAANSVNTIRFDDDVVTIPFEFQNGHDAATPGARMFEQTGGGVSVLDLDSDGWPDTYFSQGGHWDAAAKTFTRSNTETDTLYRNRQGKFDDVSKLSLPADSGFGQGSSAGDYNNDGFPDLYVGNIGPNQLLQNMGDGTFLDATSALGNDARSEWTASTVIADLNRDGLPELIDINYLTGDEIYSLICDGKGCSPSVFEAAPDHIRLGQSDGTFVTTEGAIDSKGLGCVVFASGNEGRMRLFIANDQVANVQLEYGIATKASDFSFTETAMQSGLAFNEDGLSMGCMGVAVDDISGNGLIDVFVTNFKDEANTLYLQDAPGFFVDRTKTSGLFSNGFPYVGWGTQFLDADLDGLSDVVIVNGHIDDYRDEGEEYHMPPLFYRNMGESTFEVQDQSQLGSYFEKKYLARGMARFDWNRDGAMDFVVSNIRQRAIVATNTSDGKGHFLNVILHATSTARDAIGTTVTVTVGGRTMSKQLTAGDGYMASNQRLIQFGLGAQKVVDSLEVSWPSGKKSRATGIAADVSIAVVEGREQTLFMPQ